MKPHSGLAVTTATFLVLATLSCASKGEKPAPTPLPCDPCFQEILPVGVTADNLRAEKLVDKLQDQGPFSEALWPQFNSAPLHQGVLFRRTRNLLGETWKSSDVFFPSPSSPVHGIINDVSVIAVGDAEGHLRVYSEETGELVQLMRLGYEGAEASIVGSPAIAGNDIYALTNVQPPDATFPQGVLVKVSSGDIAWKVALPDLGRTSGAPVVKEWRGKRYVFVYAATYLRGNRQGRLFVFDDSGHVMDDSFLAGCQYTITGSSGIGDFFKKLWDAWVHGREFDESGVGLGPHVDPTPAIVEVPTATGSAAGEELYIGIADNLCSRGVFSFDGEKLAKIWREGHDNFTRHSSPTLLPFHRLMVFTDEKGTVWAYDYVTGAEVWTFDAKQRGFATPAWLGQTLYVVTVHTLWELDINTGAEKGRMTLSGQTNASPLISSNRKHVLTDTGIVTLPLTGFDTRAHTTDDFNGSQFSSPGGTNSGGVFAVSEVFPGPRGRLWYWSGCPSSGC